MTAATESIAADGYTVAVAAVQIGVRVAGVVAALSISRRVRVVRPAVRHVANAHRALVGTLATVACMAQIDRIEYGSCSDMNAKDAATTTIVHQNTCAIKVSQISAPDLVIQVRGSPALIPCPQRATDERRWVPSLSSC